MSIMALLSGARPGHAADVGAVCTAAESEPPLIWYTSQDPARNDAAAKAFAGRYPHIALQVFRLATGALAARYSTEVAAGVTNAALVTIGDAIFVRRGLDQGWFTRLAKADLPAVALLNDRWFHDGATTTTINVLGLAYNSRRVKGAPPSEWKDLADPKYRGELILGDPRAIPSYMALLKVWNDELGPQFLQALLAQKPVFVPSVVPATQQLAAGEIAIVAPNTMATSAPLINDGADIKFVVPQVTTGNEFLTVLTQASRSPNAARCFYNFLLTPEGQVAYTGPTGVSPLGSAVTGGALPARYIDPVLPADRAVLLNHLGLE